jgi:hypothetical protein
MDFDKIWHWVSAPNIIKFYFGFYKLNITLACSSTEIHINFLKSSSSFKNLVHNMEYKSCFDLQALFEVFLVWCIFNLYSSQQ